MTTATLSTKISLEDKEAFDDIASSLGMSSSTVLKVFVKKFNATGGFPFEVRRERSLLSLPFGKNAVSDFDEKGYTVLPKELDCEEDDVYDRLYPNG